jgi:hypothetical protein
MVQSERTAASAASCGDFTIPDEWKELVEADGFERLEQSYTPIWGVPLLTSTGIPMGDPGTKGLLMLHSLCAEEEAALEQTLGREATVEDLLDPLPVDVPGRHFAAAGDDHLGIGPTSYLEGIGKCHQKNQMVISEGKHLISKGEYHAASYCERIVFQGPNTKFLGSSSYEEHPVVDSVKVRLISPESKDREKEGNTNPAIGKGGLLFKQLTWAPPGWEKFFYQQVPARFFQRMRKFLPKLSNGSIDPRVELPKSLGGLGLTPPSISPAWRLHEVLACLSTEHLIALTWIVHWHKKVKGVIEPPRALYVELGRYASNRYARGVRNNDGIDEIVDFLMEYTETLPYERAREQAIERFHLRPNIGYRQTHQHFKKMGLVSREDIKGILARQNFLSALLSEVPDRGFKSADWKAREETHRINLRYVLVRNDRDESAIDSKSIYEWIMRFRNGQVIDQELKAPSLLMDQRSTYTSLDGDVDEEGFPKEVNLLSNLKTSGPWMGVPFEAWGSVFTWDKRLSVT